MSIAEELEYKGYDGADIHRFMQSHGLDGIIIFPPNRNDKTMVEFFEQQREKYENARIHLQHLNVK